MEQFAALQDRFLLSFRLEDRREMREQLVDVHGRPATENIKGRVPQLRPRVNGDMRLRDRRDSGDPLRRELMENDVDDRRA